MSSLGFPGGSDGIESVLFGEMSVSVFCLFLAWVPCFSGIELHELLVYFGEYSIVSCSICLY